MPKLLSEKYKAGVDYSKLFQQEEKKDKNPDPKEDDKTVDRREELVIPLPLDDPGFFDFSKYFAFPRYGGLFNWQKEHHHTTWEAEYEETLVPRDHGKSVVYCHKYQWAMWYQDYDILLLGWTDRRKQVALDVFTFFKSQDLIELDRRTSPFHFVLKNGSKFDCYLITSKETLGMHSVGRQNRFVNLTDEEWEQFERLYREDENKEFDRKEIEKYIEERASLEKKLWISIDDPIDISFMKELHKEETLELHFNSSLYPIHPDKWSITGTHKFQGDFFTFIENKFGEELVSFKRATMNPDGTLLCPERFTHPSLPSYEDDVKVIRDDKGRILRDPKRDLAKVRKHVGEYTWWSEYEQEPHPITGDVWDHIKMIDLLDDPVERNYDLCWISIDRATTTKSTSSYTGCLIGLRHKNGQRIVTHDWTQHITLEALLNRLNNFVIEFKKKYTSLRIIIIVEKQGGGDDFLDMCRSRAFFMHQGKAIQNRLATFTELIGIHNTGEKRQRIYDRLYLPIKNEMIQLMSTLEHSEIYIELLRYPYSNFLDGVDGLANMEYELQKIPLSGENDPFLDMIKAFKEKKDKEYDDSIRSKKEQEKNARDKILRQRKQKTIFSSF